MPILAALLIQCDVHIQQPQLAATLSYEAIADTDATGTDGFDFRAHQDQASLIRVIDGIFKPRASVPRDDFNVSWGILSHNTQAKGK